MSLSKRDERTLQGMIDQAVMHSNAAFRATTKLNEWARERYGVEPGDIDADPIIDGVFGASGVSAGMTAQQFDEVMTEGSSNAKP